jgi:hypothetical protein
MLIRKGLGFPGNVDDAALGVGEEHIQGGRGVAHPEGPGGRLRKDEQHGRLIVWQFTSHEAPLTGARCIGNLHPETGNPAPLMILDFKDGSGTNPGRWKGRGGEPQPGQEQERTQAEFGLAC